MSKTAYTLPVFTVPVNPKSNRGADEPRVIVTSDTHYWWPYDEDGKAYSCWCAIDYLGGLDYHKRIQLMIDSLIAEYNTAESFDCVIFDGDMTFNDPMFKNPLQSWPDGEPCRDKNGEIVSFDNWNTVEEFAKLYLSQLTDAGIPWFAVYADHENISDETWYEIFGYEKNYILEVGGVAFICCDAFDYDLHANLGKEPFHLTADLHYDYRVAVEEYLKSEHIRDAYMVSHYPMEYPNYLHVFGNEKVSGVFAGHTHDNFLKSWYEKPMMQTGHFWMGGAQNTNTSNGVKAYIPITEDFVTVALPMNGKGYYELQKVVETATKLSVNGLLVSAVGTPDFITAGDSTYYLFGYYGTTGVYKNLNGSDFYYVDGDGELSSIEQFSFTYNVGTLCFLWDNLVYGKESNVSLDVCTVYAKYRKVDGSYGIVYKEKNAMSFYAYDGEAFRKIEKFDFIKTPRFTVQYMHGSGTAFQVYDCYYGATGNPWSFRAFEVANNGDGSYFSESYLIVPEFDYGTSISQCATYQPFYQHYLRVRPSDMGGLIDRTYWSKGEDQTNN